VDPQRLEHVFAGTARDPAAHLLRGAARVAEPLYTAAVRARNFAYDRHWLKSHPLGRPAVSVGNLTTGGTGKTPTVIDLARRLLLRGHRPAILLRGYRGQPARHRPAPGLPRPRIEHSDEQLEYHAALDPLGIPVAADPDRRRSAAYLLHHHPDISVFLLDDAFQHRRVQRDLDLVLLDAREPFGFEHCLPRGLLREPIRALNRCHGVILTRCDRVSPEQLDRLRQRVEAVCGQAPLACSEHTWGGYLDADDVRRGPEHLREAAVLGLCGLGDPDAFRHSLRQHTGQVLDLLRWPDHQPYRRSDLQRILTWAGSFAPDAEALVLPEKDWVKLRRLGLAELTPDQRLPPVWRPQLVLRYEDDAARLMSHLPHPA